MPQHYGSIRLVHPVDDRERDVLADPSPMRPNRLGARVVEILKGER